MQLRARSVALALAEGPTVNDAPAPPPTRSTHAWHPLHGAKRVRFHPTLAILCLECTAQRADAAGLDLIGIEDHPYQRRFLDTRVLMATLFAKTKQIRAFPTSDVQPPNGKCGPDTDRPAGR
jgi:hypothetical protein